MLIVDRRVRVLSEPECGGIGFLFHPEGRGRGSRKRWSASTEASMSEDGEPGVGRWKLQAGRAACCNRESSPLNISLHVCSVSRGSLPSRHRKITTTRKGRQRRLIWQCMTASRFLRPLSVSQLYDPCSLPGPHGRRPGSVPFVNLPCVC
ncbi:hypothetical protein GE09DRAFT_145488 [Coniochaeta sp. 2T2.1]|nr:hypothetical protein GE09DRAFT_145488 [Coniochaeta sp. 2T2.1]